MTPRSHPKGQFDRRKMLGLLGAGGLTAVAAGCGSSVNTGSGGGSGDEQLKVGLVIPQSGVYSTLGTDMKRGWELYLKQNNGMLGGRRVKTVTADEGETPETGVAAVQRVLQAGQVDVVVGIVSSAVALGSVDMITEAGKLFVGANAGAGQLTGPDADPLIWRASFANAQVSYAMGEHLANQDVGSVYLIAADYAAGEQAMAGFRESFEAAGGTVAGEAFTPFPDTQDFAPFLSGIRSSGAGATFCFYAGGAAVSFVQQYDSFGLKDSIPLFGSGFLTDDTILPSIGAAAEGVQTSLHYTTQLDNPANKKFLQDYRAAYDAAPTVYSVQCYDAAMVLDMAGDKAKSVKGTDMSKAMGALGEIENSPRGPWSFDGQNPKQTYYQREVRQEGGQLVNAVVTDLGVFAQPNLF